MTSEGLSTDTAGNGEEGLKKIEENLYDLVLLDLVLPGKSGMEVQREIKRIDPTLPVVIITAGHHSREEIAWLEPADIIQKPIDLQRLLDTVRRHCGTPQASSQSR